MTQFKIARYWARGESIAPHIFPQDMTDAQAQEEAHALREQWPDEPTEEEINAYLNGLD